MSELSPSEKYIQLLSGHLGFSCVCTQNSKEEYEEKINKTNAIWVLIKCLLCVCLLGLDLYWHVFAVIIYPGI